MNRPSEGQVDELAGGLIQRSRGERSPNLKHGLSAVIFWLPPDVS